MFMNFLVIHYVPGGPIDQITIQLHKEDPSFSTQIEPKINYDTIDPITMAKLKKEFNLDKSMPVRFLYMVKQYLLFDFGHSYFKGKSVNTLITEKLPVSLSLGFWGTLLVYIISIPLGLNKAKYYRSNFDWISTTILGMFYSLPPFAFALIFLIFLGSNNFLNIFPIQGLVSENFHTLSFWQKILDYLWHITLPVLSMVLSTFAKPSILMKNALVEELNKSYVTTIRAKGASENYILWKHCLRNAMLIVTSSLSHVFLNTFFYGTLIIEVLFSLDGLGHLSFEATANRDYPVMFACLYIYTLVGILLHIFSDFFYNLIDPRVNVAKDAL